ncbi:hypothetical protein MSM1_12995 [Mycobacterium sp. SM1]|uniref:hypothetical protein n=1 Tax=Mycobacterium sp. SM1 TaxID=2816243 RepID=UPI001BD112B1|nr:hypothetical protein [Mycobacterium sp. SM1]MBS4729216.1 hypothetical protein [Mycobacterium sp. SM1]
MAGKVMRRKPAQAPAGRPMTNEDAGLETHIREFLRALNERPDQLIRKHLAEIEKPDPRDMEDVERYINDLKRIYGQGLEDMYERIGSHGRAICELTDETEITERVEKMMTLVAADAEHVPKILASLEDAASEPNLLTTVRLFQTLLTAGAHGQARQGQLDALMLDFTTYCLTRFPPAE